MSRKMILCAVSAIVAVQLAAGLANAKVVMAPAGTTKAKPAATIYECSKCHMKFSAADAKKMHYKDSMDGGALVAVKPAKSK